MALTNAERQAAYKAKKTDAIEMLTAANAALTAENAKLQNELKKVTEKFHKFQLETLRAQVKKST
jgi:uncharacterized coiled-coil protein SlyX